MAQATAIIIFGLIGFFITLGCSLSVHRACTEGVGFTPFNEVNHIFGFIAGSCVFILGLFFIGFVLNK